ncbi:MAG TPA: hypothetical protein VFF06_07280 [Polyangia bacterium]|nr:hypothetical protein [Polyangia bacterium]
MSFVSVRLPKPPREYWRCVACGKVSLSENFGMLHDLQVLVQEWAGGGNRGWRRGSTKKERKEQRKETGEKGGGFAWTKRGMSRRELAALASAMRDATERLEMLLCAIAHIDDGDDLESVLAELELDGDDELTRETVARLTHDLGRIDDRRR